MMASVFERNEGAGETPAPGVHSAFAPPKALTAEIVRNPRGEFGLSNVDLSPLALQ